MALIPTTGTVSITGDLSVDIAVNGNLTVSGEISSNAKATGTISYGSLTGSAESEAELEACDIEVDGGTLTFASTVSESDGGMYTTGRVTNVSGVTASVFGSLTIYSSSTANMLYNNGGTFIVADGGYVSVSTKNSDSGSGALRNNGIFTVDAGGELVCNNAGHPAIYNYSTFNCYGKTTATETSGDAAVTNNGGSFTIFAGGEVILSGFTYGFSNYSSSASEFVLESGGKLTTSGGTYGFSNAVGTATISGGIYATGTGSSSYGIYNTSTITIEKGSQVEATGVGYGMRNTSTATIGGTLTAEGTGSSGIGLYNSAGTMNIEETAEIIANGVTYGAQTAGTINFYGAMTVEGSYGLYNTGTFNVNGEFTSISSVTDNPGIRNTGTIVVSKVVRAYNSEVTA